MSGANRWRLILAGLGLLDSAYVTLVHYTAAVPLACPETGIINCAQVLTSPQSVVLGLPLGVWGVVWFLVLGALVWRASSAAGAALPRRLWVVVGMLSVVYFVYLELAVIGKICIFCTGVHLIVVALFIMEAVGVA